MHIWWFHYWILCYSVILWNILSRKKKFVCIIDLSWSLNIGIFYYKLWWIHYWFSVTNAHLNTLFSFSSFYFENLQTFIKNCRKLTINIHISKHLDSNSNNNFQSRNVYFMSHLCYVEAARAWHHHGGHGQEGRYKVHRNIITACG